jgi:hypothetical protein
VHSTQGILKGVYPSEAPDFITTDFDRNPCVNSVYQASHFIFDGMEAKINSRLGSMALKVFNSLKYNLPFGQENRQEFCVRYLNHKD